MKTYYRPAPPIEPKRRFRPELVVILILAAVVVFQYRWIAEDESKLKSLRDRVEVLSVRALEPKLSDVAGILGSPEKDDTQCEASGGDSSGLDDLVPWLTDERFDRAMYRLFYARNPDDSAMRIETWPKDPLSRYRYISIMMNSWEFHDRVYPRLAGGKERQ